MHITAAGVPFSNPAREFSCQGCSQASAAADCACGPSDLHEAERGRPKLESQHDRTPGARAGGVERRFTVEFGAENGCRTGLALSR
ncbi:MAG: hypothetical protein OXC08_20235 [Thiotrichales bacterium]|nr:hypothetical protein [Thiotrichales bacterium]